MSSSALYCSSAASFSDPFEGAIGLVENRPDYEAEIAAQLKRLKEETLGGLTPQEAVVRLERESFLRRKTTFVNCWYESDHESMAMWRLYSTDNSNAVAIRTTYGRMRDALKVKTGVGIGRVNYIDFSNPPEGVIQNYAVGFLNRSVSKCIWGLFSAERRRTRRSSPSLDQRWPLRLSRT